MNKLSTPCYCGDHHFMYISLGFTVQLQRRLIREFASVYVAFNGG